MAATAMGWLQRLRGAPAEPQRPVSDRASPGLAALFAGVREDATHSVLDLGQAAESSLNVYGRFARRVRFADLIAATATEGWAAALRELPPQPDAPYDLVLAWDIMDRLPVDERPRLVERLTAVTAPDARLLLVVDAAEKKTHEPQRFTLLDVDRVRSEPIGAARPAQPPLLPARVERLLAPFRVLAGYTLKVGVREYLATRKPATSTSGRGRPC